VTDEQQGAFELNGDARDVVIPSTPDVVVDPFAALGERPQLTLFEVEESWRALWKGMPEFVQENLEPLKTIYVHFETRADMAAFSALVDQKITMQTRSIWFPENEVALNNMRRYIDALPSPDEAPIESARADVETVELDDEA